MGVVARLETQDPQSGRARSDVRGAVYVEFLVAFMPVFVMFLATTQLALLTAAKLVVQHAATSAARSAIVILEDDPERFDGAPRGSLTDKESGPAALELLSALELPGIDGVVSHAADDDGEVAGDAQRGARMVPIRTAAYFPLLALAPDASVLEGNPADDVASSLTTELGRRAASALEYTRAATVVSVHSAPGTEELARHIGKKEPVTVRVTYVVHCAVPLARSLVCNPLGDLVERHENEPHESEDVLVALGRRFATVESRSGFERLAASGARFVVFEAEATLPNQGAEYEPTGSD